MVVESIRKYCLSLPRTTETVQWGSDLVFKVGGKMYAVAALEPMKVWLSFKCSAENFALLTERQGIIPAPYLARAHWVGLERDAAIRFVELKPLLKEAYDIVVAGLPQRTRVRLRV